MKGFQRLALSALWDDGLWEVFAALEKPLQQVEEFLRQAVQSPVRDITEMALHLLSAGGKRLRPALTLLSAQLVGSLTSRAIIFAAVVELMHTATLIHDDVIDKAELRRGRAAVHTLWGNEAAVMCGDHLYARAFSILAEDGDLEVIRTMATASSRVCEGEVLELQWAFNPHIGEAECLEIARLKTAELMAASCKVGALAVHADRKVVKALETFGRQLGIAFQIVDDVLDLEGSVDELGKPVGSDLLEGKITLPVRYALDALQSSEREWWVQRIKSRTISQGDVAQLAQFAREKGILEGARQVACQFAGHALSVLQKLPLNDHPLSYQTLRLLKRLTHFIVQRRL